MTSIRHDEDFPMLHKWRLQSFQHPWCPTWLVLHLPHTARRHFSKHFGFPCQMSLQLPQFINHPITDDITSAPTALLNNEVQRLVSKKTSWMYKPSYFEGVSSRGCRRIYYVGAYVQLERTKLIQTQHNCILTIFPEQIYFRYCKFKQNAFHKKLHIIHRIYCTLAFLNVTALHVTSNFHFSIMIIIPFCWLRIRDINSLKDKIPKPAGQ
jgi:hypothetical protein